MFIIQASEIISWDSQLQVSDKTFIQSHHNKLKLSTHNSMSEKILQFLELDKLTLTNLTMLLINISVQLNPQYKVKFQINNNHFSLHLSYSTEMIKFQTQVSVLVLLLQAGMIQIFLPCTISKESLVNIELISILELI